MTFNFNTVNIAKINGKSLQLTQTEQTAQKKQAAVQDAQDEAVVLQTEFDDADISTDALSNTSKTDSDLSKLSAEELTSQMNELKTVIENLEKEALQYEQLLQKQQDELNSLVQQYEAETKTLEDYEQDFDYKQSQLADLNDRIDFTQNVEQEKYDNKISDITNAAINNYNPEKHGDDFNTYLNEELSNVGIGGYSALDSLNSEAVALADETNTLLSDITSQANIVRNLADKISVKQKDIAGTQADLDAKNSQIDIQKTQFDVVRKQLAKLTGAGLTAAEVLASISDEEKALVTDNNIDLTEKLPDGSAKYVAAMGEDGKFHFYEMTDSGSATSLARQYGSDAGGLRGSDIVPSGSGYMNDINDAAEGKGRAVYTFSDVNPCLTDGCACSSQKCYTTCSPLSFDVDGNGINTTASTLQYDIDGDGKLDTVNNSAEWVLAFDKDGNGIAGENGSELFGDNTDLDGDGVKDGFANGFDALKALANKENLINGSDDNTLDEHDIQFLQEKYGLVMTDGYGGAAKSLSDLGISEINLAKSNDTTLTKNFDGRNNNIMTQEGATFKVNGQTRQYADIWNAKLDSPVYQNSNDKNIQRSDVSLSENNKNISELFDKISKNFNSALSFLNHADSLSESNAITREVDYISAITENKINAKAKDSDEYFEKTDDELNQQTSQNDEEYDEDFVNFQKRKLQ